MFLCGTTAYLFIIFKGIYNRLIVNEFSAKLLIEMSEFKVKPNLTTFFLELVAFACRYSASQMLFMFSIQASASPRKRLGYYSYIPSVFLWCVFSNLGRLLSHRFWCYIRSFLYVLRYLQSLSQCLEMVPGLRILMWRLLAYTEVERFL